MNGKNYDFSDEGEYESDDDEYENGFWAYRIMLCDFLNFLDKWGMIEKHIVDNWKPINVVQFFEYEIAQEHAQLN